MDFQCDRGGLPFTLCLGEMSRGMKSPPADQSVLWKIKPRLQGDPSDHRAQIIKDVKFFKSI